MKFFKRNKDKQPNNTADRGLILFSDTSTAIRAEKILKKENFSSIKMVAPPTHIRIGCDLALEFFIIHQLDILRILNQKKIHIVKIIPIADDILEPLHIYRITDFKDYLMVRASNMKLTVEKNTKKIVNISGGGCPDVPFLANSMIGQTIYNSPSPADLGHTLCGYMLNLAFEEAKRILI